MTRLTIPLRWRPALWVILGVILTVLLVIGITTGLKGKAADFFCFYEAAVCAAREGRNLYAMEVRNGGYIYPPLMAMVLTPLAHLGPKAAAVVWKLGTITLLLIATWLAAGETRRRFALPVEPNGGLAVAALVWLLLADKLVAEVQLGQCDFLLIIPFVLALRWMERRPLAAGLVLGFAFHVKYLAIIFLPYLLLRGRWKTAAAMIAGILAFAFLPALYFGWDTNLDYLNTAFRGLNRMAQGQAGNADAAASANIYPIHWIRSISFPSVAARLALRLDAGGWLMPMLVAGIALSIFTLAAVFYAAHSMPLFRGRLGRDDDAAPGRPAVVLLEWSGLIVAALLFSPQTTARHMVMLFPVFFAAGQLVLRGRPGTPRTLVAAGLAALLLGLILPPGGNQGVALETWRWIGGVSWCLTFMYLTLLWAGLHEARTLAIEEHLRSRRTLRPGARADAHTPRQARA